MRFAFTIVLNGEHHLKDGHIQALIPHFDKWIFVEGASGKTGSTGWVQGSNIGFHKNGSSIDNTIAELNKLKRQFPDKVVIVKNSSEWPNKDFMVNTAILKLKEYYNLGFLWEMDVDEHWIIEHIEQVEKELTDSQSKTACCKQLILLGDGLTADGPNWGRTPINRCWNWTGEFFKTHEPPELDTFDESVIIPSEGFVHNSYTYAHDIVFKGSWYFNDNQFFNRLKKIRLLCEKGLPLSALFPDEINSINYRYYNYKGTIKRIENDN